MLLPDDDLQLAALPEEPAARAYRGRADAARGLTAAARAFGRRCRTLPTSRSAGAAEKLRRWRSMADQVTPFRFFATVLGPDGGRRAFRARLGGEADDVLDAFLSQALAYEAIEPPSLQGFLALHPRQRERHQARGGGRRAAGVRVMTVHGAKGLEADVVFLVDTGGPVVVPSQRDMLVDVGKDARRSGLPLAAADGAKRRTLQRDADAVADDETRTRVSAPPLCRDDARARRALRRRDPAATGRQEIAGTRSWSDALVPADRPAIPKQASSASPINGRSRRGRRCRDRTTSRLQPKRRRPMLPDWLSRGRRPSPVPAPATAAPVASAGGTGSRGLRRRRARAVLLSGADLALAARSGGAPAAAASAGRARGGTAPVRRMRLLGREFPDDPALAESVIEETRSRARRSGARRFVRAEQPRRSGDCRARSRRAQGDYAVSGRIDRLVRTAAGWRILDFKTDRACPLRWRRSTRLYVLQMALYRRLLMEMEPGAGGGRTLVYTAGPNIMPIPAPTMEKALAELGIRAIAGSLTRIGRASYLRGQPTSVESENDYFAVTDANFATDVLGFAGTGHGRFLGRMVRALQDDRAASRGNLRPSSTAR